MEFNPSPPPVPPRSAARKRHVASGTEAAGGAAAVVFFAVVLAVCWWWFFWRIEPGNGQIAVLIKKTGKNLPASEIIALSKEYKGIQADAALEVASINLARAAVQAEITQIAGEGTLWTDLKNLAPTVPVK